MKEKNKKIYMYTSIIVLIIIDQIFKKIVELNIYSLPLKIINNLFQISYFENFGIAFGIGTGNLIIYIIGNIVIIGLIFKFIISQDQRLDYKDKFVLSLILAGGISNLIDRIIRGYVVDYLEIIKLFAFNIADILIFVGIIGFGISSLKYMKSVSSKKNTN